MTQMKEKLIDMQAAVQMIPDGSRLAIGGMTIHAHPMAFVRELIRQGKKDLTIVGSLNGMETDMLAAAGALRRVESSAVSMERYGLARCFRRGVEQRQFEMVEYSDYSAFNRFIASQCDLPFWPCDYLGGSDIPTYNTDIKPYQCPVSGKQMYAIPPANADYAIIHAAAADAYGNVLMPQRILFPQADDILFARASKHVIVTVERIISNALVRRNTNMVQLHKHKVTAVVLAPYGAHPCSFPQFYNVDDAHMRQYMEASRSQEGMDSYLDTYVRGIPDHYAYLDMMGSRRLSDINLPTFI